MIDVGGKMMLSERIVRACAVLAAGVLSATVHADGSPRFPQVSATSLVGSALNLPADFGSPAALVFVAFAMKQQPDIDAWKPIVDKARGKYPSLQVWELPTIGSGYKIMRGFIEGGMRSGIKSQAGRESTVTLFLDTRAFAKAIGAARMGEISVLVVAPDGSILGRAEGRPTGAGESAIDAALSSAFAPMP
jgi:hypothetical protein